MMTPALLAILRPLLEAPTAPFHEDAVARVLAELLAACPHVTLEADAFGNRIARYRRGPAGDAPPRLAFAAHLDHPGWVRNAGGEWEFLGGVPAEMLERAPRPAGDGPFAMWELPACELREGRVYSRACDDLAGCAAIVSLFYALEAAQAPAHCWGLFTRAEEVGLVGALELARSGVLPPETTVVSLETSPARPPAEMGSGVIVRVGDRLSVFDPGFTAQATALAAARGIPHQRCLMPGGACEGTAFALYGVRTGALCIALGNYHNCGPGHTVAPEYVSAGDLQAMADLCAALAMEPPVDPAAALRTRLEANAANQQVHFRPLPL